MTLFAVGGVLVISFTDCSFTMEICYGKTAVFLPHSIIFFINCCHFKRQQSSRDPIYWYDIAISIQLTTMCYDAKGLMPAYTGATQCSSSDQLTWPADVSPSAAVAGCSDNISATFQIGIIWINWHILGVCMVTFSSCCRNYNSIQPAPPHVGLRVDWWLQWLTIAPQVQSGITSQDGPMLAG